MLIYDLNVILIRLSDKNITDFLLDR